MKTVDLEKIYKLSEKKKNGVYSYAGQFIYAVEDLAPVVVGDKYSGELYQISHGFVVGIGKCKSYETRKKIVAIFKEITNDAR